MGILGLLLLFSIATILAVGGYVLIAAREIRNPVRHSTGWALAKNFPASPNEVQLNFESWQLDCPDGSSLPIWDIPANTHAPTDDVPTLIILHGWGHSRIDSLQRLTALLQANPTMRAREFRTILVDFRGHGDAPDGPTSLGDTDVDDVCALLKQLNTKKAVLLGHSLGAVVAIHVAAREPERVRGVVALAPYDQLITPIASSLRKRGLPTGATTPLIASLCTSKTHLSRDTHAGAQRVTQPLHVLIGNHDLICPPATAQTIAQAAPHGTFTLIEDCEHSNHHLVAPETIADALGALLSEPQAST